MALIGLVTYSDEPFAVVRQVILTSKDKPDVLEDPQWLDNLEQDRSPVMNVVEIEQAGKLGYVWFTNGDTKYDWAEHVGQLRVFVEKTGISAQEKGACTQELAALLVSEDQAVIDGIALADAKPSSVADELKP